MAHFSNGRLQRLRVAVLAGGDSRERDISLESGCAVVRTLTVRGHRVTLIDPAQVNLLEYDWNGFEVAFLALHGTFGEDGQVQQILDEIGIPYTGSNADASRLAFSKSASKERFLQFGVPAPPYVLIHESDDAARIQQHARSIGYPLVIKPDAQGSSLGVSIVESPEQLPQAISRCFHYDSFGLIEAAVCGTEWTVGLLDDRLLPPILIETDRPFFDFTAKYEDNATRYVFEFDVPANVVKAIENAARNACDALGTRGLVRVDLRLDSLERPWVLEVNTIPGLTNHSLIPKAAAKTGLSLGQLCEQTISSCLAMRETHPQSR